MDPRELRKSLRTETSTVFNKKKKKEGGIRYESESGFEMSNSFLTVSKTFLFAGNSHELLSWHKQN